MRCLVMPVAVVAALVALAGCSAEPVSGAPVPSAAAPTSAPLTADQKYLADVLDTPGLTSTMPDAETIKLGHMACEVMAYQQYSRADLIASLGESKLGPAVMTVIVDAAQRSICPQYEFPAVTTTGGGAASPAGGSSGPVTTVSPGTYEVGTGDGQVAPGTYRSPGPTTSTSCYYARLKRNDGAYGDIIANELGQGQTIMIVKASDGFVQVKGCTFTK